MATIAEIVQGGVDQNCDGIDDIDEDVMVYSLQDCDDLDSSVYPGALDAYCDNVNSDCMRDSIGIVIRMSRR